MMPSLEPKIADDIIDATHISSINDASKSSKFMVRTGGSSSNDFVFVDDIYFDRTFSSMTCEDTLSNLSANNEFHYNATTNKLYIYDTTGAYYQYAFNGVEMTLTHDASNLVTGAIDYAQEYSSDANVIEIFMNGTGLTETGSFTDADSATLRFMNMPESIPINALAINPSGQMQGLSATGNSGIGSALGNISDTIWSNLVATNTNLLPIPHPNQSTTPAGTGEVSFTPRSAASTFMCMANVGFGWIGAGNGVQVHFVVARKIGNGSWTIAGKLYNVLNGDYGTDMNVSPFYVDAPNTTSTVTYKWMIVKGNTNAIYPIAQSVAFQEFTNL